MKQNLEIEYKTMLDEEGYNTFQDSWDFSSGVQQVNIYLDTPDNDLYNQGVMCRLRLTDVVEFTLKVPKQDGVMEHEMQLDSLDVTQNNAIRELLESFNVNVDALETVAQSNTLRKTFLDKYGLWCLDFTEFDHGYDYEIEYELHQADENAFEHYVNQLRSLGIEYKKSRPKYIRARFPDLI